MSNRNEEKFLHGIKNTRFPRYRSMLQLQKALWTFDFAVSDDNFLIPDLFQSSVKLFVLFDVLNIAEDPQRNN